MRIWQLTFEVDEYDNLMPVSELSVEQIQSFDGRSHLNKWKPIRVKRMEPEKGLELSDAPGFIIPVFSQKALDCLLPLMGTGIEVLPLAFKEKKFYGINIVEVLDAIDYEKSEYVPFRDGKRIMVFKKYAFLPGVVGNSSIFKIKEEKLKYAFVSDQFKEEVEANGLTGFIFKLVWDSEA